jgi:hypothetical protein
MTGVCVDIPSVMYICIASICYPIALHLYLYSYPERIATSSAFFLPYPSLWTHWKISAFYVHALPAGKSLQRFFTYHRIWRETGINPTSYLENCICDFKLRVKPWDIFPPWRPSFVLQIRGDSKSEPSFRISVPRYLG